MGKLFISTSLTQINWNSLKVPDYFQYPLRGISTFKPIDRFYLNKMENIIENTSRIVVSIPENIITEFIKINQREGVSSAALLAQFMVSYINFLDRDFIKITMKKRQKPNKAFMFYAPQDIYDKFQEKVNKDKVENKFVLAQFMTNYVDFMHNRKQLSVLKPLNL
jgi:hypothetical protein